MKETKKSLALYPTTCGARLVATFVSFMTVGACSRQPERGGEAETASHASPTNDQSTGASAPSTTSPFAPRGVWSSGCVEARLGGSYQIDLAFSGSTVATTQQFFDLSGCQALRERLPPDNVPPPHSPYEVVGNYQDMPGASVVAWHSWTDDPQHPLPEYGIVAKEGDTWLIAQTRTSDASHPGARDLLKFHLVAQ